MMHGNSNIKFFPLGSTPNLCMHSASPLYAPHDPPIFIPLDMITQYYMETGMLHEASHYVILSSLLLLPPS